jgi:hypothetical protein
MEFHKTKDKTPKPHLGDNPPNEKNPKPHLHSYSHDTINTIGNYLFAITSSKQLHHL